MAILAYPINKPINRYHRRKIDNEVKRVSRQVLELELTFTKKLSQNNSYSYKVIYNRYLSFWIDLYKRLTHYGKLKHIVINKDYFKQMYQPLENLDNEI